jgi:hypothetical protein
MTNRSITAELEDLERKWVSALQARFDGTIPWPPRASDEVQFFTAEAPLQTAPDDGANIHAASRPLHVVCVGLSYNAYRHEVLGKVTPHIQTRTNGETWVVDNKRSSTTRRALDAALAAYSRDSHTWVAHGYASAADLIPRESGALTLIKTFVSPFLPTKPWSEFGGTVRKAMFDAWNPNEHICDLIQTLGNRLDLWVIHGSAIWPHFVTNSTHIQRWMLMPTLSHESQRNRAIATFWKTPRREDEQAQPCFPSC